MIEIEGISKNYDGQINALRDVSFQVNTKGLLTILGPSGSGKTTLLRLIAGLEMPHKGKILLDSKVVTTPYKIVPPYKRRLAMIFQGLSLWPHMTVEQHLKFVLRKDAKKVKQKKIEGMLDKVRLNELKRRYPHQLSGGEKQRLAIARALITHPSYLLMDEPFSSLDFLLKKEMISLILDLRKNLDVTILYVTHNLDEAMVLVDDIIMINKGEIVFKGNREKFSEVYGDWFKVIKNEKD